MSLVILLDYILSGVPSNAVWDLIKSAWQKATGKSWEDLYLEAFEDVVNKSISRLSTYSDDGEVSLDRSELSAALHYDLGISVDALPFSTMSNEEFIASIAKVMESKSLLRIGGHNLLRNDYVYLVKNLIRQVNARFKSSILANELTFRRVLLDESLASQTLLQETQAYLANQFQIVYGKLDNIERKLENASILSKSTLVKEVITDKPMSAINQTSRSGKTSIFLVPSLPPQGVFGRDKTLKKIADLLEFNNQDATNVPPLALLGMGGIGKTTLAIALARQKHILTWFPDGVLWVSVGPTPNIRLLLDDWGRVLGIDLIAERDENSCRERLRAFLHFKRALLIIDDVWETTDGQYFNVGGPYCRTLITTRDLPVASSLATRGRTIRVDVLKPEAALALLNTLAPEALATDEKNAKRLCKRLEYLPLALTLAGRFLANEADVPPRMQRLLAELIERRKTRLNLLQVEGRLGLDSQIVSLQAILGMSVDRLDKTDQERFVMLAVFGAKPLIWEIEAAAHVWECAVEDAEETISRFIQRELVMHHSNKDYWTHALLSDYAAEMDVGAGIMSSSWERYAQYYLTYAQNHPKEWRWLDKRWPQIQRAWDWVSEKSRDKTLVLQYIETFFPFQELRGLWHQSFEWCKQGLELSQALGQRQSEFACLFNLGKTCSGLSDFNRAISFYQLAKDVAQRVEDKRSTGDLLGHLGITYDELGDSQHAIKFYEQALVIAQEVGDKPNEGKWLGNLGRAYHNLSDVDNAIRCYERALAIAQEVGDKRAEGKWLGNLGLVYYRLGDARRARTYHEQSLEVADETGDQKMKINALGNLGIVAVILGNFELAISYFERALMTAREIGDRKSEGTWLGNLGITHKNFGNLQIAIKYSKEALVIAQEVGDKRNEMNWLNNLGIINKNLGNMENAIKYYEQVLAATRETGDKRLEGAVLGNLGVAYAELKDYQSAIQHYEKALTIAREIGDQRHKGVWLGRLAFSYNALGNVQSALKYANESLAIAREMGAKDNEGRSLGYLGQIYFTLGETATAIDCYTQGLRICREVGDQHEVSDIAWRLGDVYEKLGKYQRAAELMQIKVDYDHSIGHSDLEKYKARLAEVRAKLNQGNINKEDMESE